MRAPRRHVVGGQQPAMQHAARIEPFGLAAEAVDRLGDEALVERVMRRLALRRAVTAGRFGLGHEAPEEVPQCFVAEPAAGGGRATAGEIDRGAGRPGLAEQLGHVGDIGGEHRDDRIAAARIADRRLQNVGERHRAMIAEQHEPAAHRARHHRGEKPGAGDEIEAEFLVACDRRRRRGWALGTQHLRRLFLGAPEDDRHVAARSILVRLDDLEDEARRGRRVEGVAAALEHGHAGG